MRSREGTNVSWRYRNDQVNGRRVAHSGARYPTSSAKFELALANVLARALTMKFIRNCFSCLLGP
jgi:hypothetical protein